MTSEFQSMTWIEINALWIAVPSQCLQPQCNNGRVGIQGNNLTTNTSYKHSMTNACDTKLIILVTDLNSDRNTQNGFHNDFKEKDLQIVFYARHEYLYYNNN